ncbi:MAG TPA: rRNA maturation RNase YbeY [bacterium]|nr:rRNA maturation RNase YbeY [bacterium]
MVDEALARLECAGARVEISLVDDESIRVVNRDFLGRDRPTNVISFPDDAPDALGELMVNVDFARRQAQETKRDIHYVLGYYIIHGLLHLAGYDHERSGPEAAARMQERQDQMEDLLVSLDRGEKSE